MDRRQFMQRGAAAAAVTLAASRASAALPAAARRFEVTTRVDLAAATGTQAAQAWLPLFTSDAAYQRVLEVRAEGGGRARIVRAGGVAMLHASWREGEAKQPLVLTQRLATWERTTVPGRLGAGERARFTAATAMIPTDGAVRELARGIVGERREPRAQVRAIYDWMLANTWRDPATPGCGAGDVNAMLRDHRLAGKCVDLSRLFVALVRSIGIPAREVYGQRLAPSASFRSLGRGGDVSTAQHCRAEAWLEDGAGRGQWFACDPADVRKAVLEEKLPLGDPGIQALGERLFGKGESNWGGYNHAGALVLPGATLAPRYDFLMYPVAMTRTALCNCLDPKAFGYEIASREIPA
ncbi:MAG: transglutaminase domain-containing protein [Sphingomonadales bacterium]|nr:transglutaminase domain-containing protein [Sphingomonadales bacterium]